MRCQAFSAEKDEHVKEKDGDGDTEGMRGHAAARAEVAKRDQQRRAFWRTGRARTDRDYEGDRFCRRE
eukprot:128242-Rhodomonas_salina.1